MNRLHRQIEIMYFHLLPDRDGSVQKFTGLWRFTASAVLLVNRLLKAKNAAFNCRSQMAGSRVQLT